MRDKAIILGFMDGMKEAGYVGDALRWAARQPRLTAEGALHTLAHPGAALKKGYEEFKQTGLLGKGMMVGFGGLGLHNDLRKKDHYTGVERGVGERVLGAAGNVFGTVATLPMGVVPGMVVGVGLGEGGKYLGRKADQAVAGVFNGRR